LTTKILSTQPYDGDDDALVGVVNKSGATVFGISLTGNGIFGFDGDGLCTFIACSWPHPTGYEGPGMSFTVINANRGTVNFTGAGLADGASTFFSLENSPQSTQLASSVTIDPGHGHTCPPPSDSPGQHQGTTGGGLSEDDLTVPVATALQTLLTNASYAVTMTKTDANSCPTLRDRAKTANHARSNLFVSIHFNKPLSLLERVYKSYGTAGLYSSTKSDAQKLAGFLAKNVGTQLGLNFYTEVSEVNVLVPSYTEMTSSIIEVGRLDGPDLTAIKAPGSAAKAAAGIKAGIDAFISQ
jgi:N-acetylmuramoyl-L-alanine amidase